MSSDNWYQGRMFSDNERNEAAQKSFVASQASTIGEDDANSESEKLVYCWLTGEADDEPYDIAIMKDNKVVGYLDSREAANLFRRGYQFGTGKQILTHHIIGKQNATQISPDLRRAS
jgi:hypothetical protein